MKPARCSTLSRVQAIYEGPMWTGKVGDHGTTALVKSGGLQIIVTSKMQQPIDLALAKSLGVDCTQMKYICVKSTGHFRSGFGPIAGSIFNVDAKGCFTQNFASIPFTRLGRKVYPMDPDTTFP